MPFNECCMPPYTLCTHNNIILNATHKLHRVTYAIRFILCFFFFFQFQLRECENMNQCVNYNTHFAFSLIECANVLLPQILFFCFLKEQRKEKKSPIIEG